MSDGLKSKLIKTGSVVTAVGVLACLFLSGDRIEQPEQPARQYINRQGYKPVLRARQGPVLSSNTTSPSGNTTDDLPTSGGSGSVIILA